MTANKFQLDSNDNNTGFVATANKSAYGQEKWKI